MFCKCKERLLELEGKMKQLERDQAALRGLVNRKLGRHYEFEGSEEDPNAAILGITKRDK